MAITDRIIMDPELLRTKAGEFETRGGEFEALIETMERMTTELTEEWAGMSSQAFYDQFKELQPNLEKAVTLCLEISEQLKDVSDALMTFDSDIAKKIGNPQ